MQGAAWVGRRMLVILGTARFGVGGLCAKRKVVWGSGESVGGGMNMVVRVLRR